MRSEQVRHRETAERGFTLLGVGWLGDSIMLTSPRIEKVLLQIERGLVDESTAKQMLMAHFYGDQNRSLEVSEKLAEEVMKDWREGRYE